MTKKLLAEVIGTYFLVLAIGMAVIAPGAGALAPVAIGLTLMIMVYSCGPISGAHFNPAVTLGLWIRGACPTREVLPYFGAEIAGAVMAAFTVLFLKPDSAAWLLENPSAVQAGPAVLAELLFTFALVWVVLNVATAKRSEGNSYFGFAIGGTVMAGAFAVGPISSAVFNPAVAVALGIMGLMPWENLWIYLVANFGGGALAAAAFLFANGKE